MLFMLRVYLRKHMVVIKCSGLTEVEIEQYSECVYLEFHIDLFTVYFLTTSSIESCIYV